MGNWKISKKMLLKNPKTIAKTIAQAIWKNIAIVQYFCCLKNYLNTAFFKKKYCNRVFAIFYCAITMVWLCMPPMRPISSNYPQLPLIATLDNRQQAEWLVYCSKNQKLSDRNFKWYLKPHINIGRYVLSLWRHLRKNGYYVV